MRRNTASNSSTNKKKRKNKAAAATCKEQPASSASSQVPPAEAAAAAAMSARKILERKYNNNNGGKEAPWNLLMNQPHMLGASKHAIIIRQAMMQAATLQQQPGGCFVFVNHKKAENLPTHNVYECVVSSGLHWAEDASKIKDPEVIPLTRDVSKGFVLLVNGSLTKVEDLATTCCCRDQRRISYSITPVSKSEFQFSEEMAKATGMDTILQIPKLLDAQDTGEEGGCTMFIATLKEPSSPESFILPLDRESCIKISDDTAIMFFEKCFVWVRNFRFIHHQNNDVMQGIFWQV
jgi:hypothetical protein